MFEMYLRRLIGLILKTIITFIFVFGLIVIAHEFGHFYFAKKAGILVREFAIGMGPKIFSIRKNQTTYTIRLLPIGGYVRLADENEENEDLKLGMRVILKLDQDNKVQTINASDKMLFDGVPIEITEFDLEDKLYIKGYVMGNTEDVQTFDVYHDALIIEKDGTEVQIAPKDVQFQSAKLSSRMMTNFAGPMNNFILAIILFMIVAFIQGGIADTTNTKLGNVEPNSPAYEAGLRDGMIIKEIDNHSVKDWNDLSKAIKSSEGEVKVTVLDNNKNKTFNITPKYQKIDNKKQALIGIAPSKDTSLWAKIKYGFSMTISSSTMIFKALGDLITGFSLDKLGGPVAIFKMSETAASNGLINILFFTATLSINLGIVNLLPLPALDGGKLALNIYEGVRGKPLDRNKENLITIIGFVFLFGLMILVTWNDLRRFFF